jgi:sugar PTS system EIIA component
VAVAPVTGDLVKLFPGGHAFGISMNDGVELIVHIGLDTIELKGLGFENIATEGQVVRAGAPIVSFDRGTIERMGKVMLSPVVSSGAGTIVRRASGVVRAGQDVLFVLNV